MGKFQDITGKRFGRLLVISRAPDRIQPSGQHCRMWYCKCDCGNNCIVSAQNLKNGHTKSCGCIFTEMLSAAHFDDLTGKTFNNIYIIKKAGAKKYPSGGSDILWNCKCLLCGKTFTTHAQSIRSGTCVSCGCIKRADLTGKQFYWLTVIERAPDITNKKGESITRWLCRCKCGKEVVVRTNCLTGGGTKSCGCLGSSVSEIEISNMLKQLNIDYIREYTFEDLKTGDKPRAKPRFDFAIFNNDKLAGLIEYQGPHHYIPRFKGWGDKQRLVTDPIKRNYCKTNNIPLLEIPYTEDYKTLIVNFLKDINISYANPVPSTQKTV